MSKRARSEGRLRSSAQLLELTGQLACTGELRAPPADLLPELATMLRSYARQAAGQVAALERSNEPFSRRLDAKRLELVRVGLAWEAAAVELDRIATCGHDPGAGTAAEGDESPNFVPEELRTFAARGFKRTPRRSPSEAKP